MAQLILCRYGELWLKSKPVMDKFYSKLISNMHKTLTREQVDFKIMRKRNRAFVDTEDPEKVIEILKRVPGLISISPVLKIDMDLDTIEKELLRLAEIKLKGNKKTWAVKVKRVGTHDITSKEMESRWGFAVGSIYDNPVDLSRPEIPLNVEVRNSSAYIFTDTYQCAGGLPVGVEGTVAALIETEDDIIAAYLIMKRGCDVIAITDNKKLAEKLLRSTPHLEIIEFKKDWTDALKTAIEKHEAKAFVNGENLKTMTDLEKDIELPILRPLIGIDDKKIKEIRTKIFD
ncbi:MAG: hypothetical protein GQ477_04215 [Nanohaloarchaea archaeon]|nr:hypothetical protein [Candidatus Nanohaloarchaea archaeon]